MSEELILMRGWPGAEGGLPRDSIKRLSRVNSLGG